MKLSQHIEHALVKPDALLADVEILCQEAAANSFAAVCVPPLFVKKVKGLLDSTPVSCTVVTGFPYGYSAIEAKVAEIVLAVIDGADEIEMVVNTCAVKNNDWQFLANELNTVLQIVRSKSRKITVVWETGLMTDAEMIKCCDLYGAAGVDFVKAGTGTIENAHLAADIALIRKHLAEPVLIKAGIDAVNYATAKKIINAGANRLSCGNGLKLVQEALQQN